MKFMANSAPLRRRTTRCDLACRVWTGRLPLALQDRRRAVVGLLQQLIDSSHQIVR